jgi:predicted amidophosphoribosyltransferase
VKREALRRERYHATLTFMFCPHCGATLIETSGELRCERTGMPLSGRLRRGLTEVFIDRARASRRGPPGMARLRHPFFCPGCAVQLTPDGCPRCGEVLDEFAHDIVELHPHE